MPRRRTIDVEAPIGGIDRSMAFQNQPPYTTIHAVNVRGTDVSAERRRIGSRPGLSKAFALQLGTSTNRAVRMLTSIRSVQPTPLARYVDEFSGAAMTADWDAASWATNGLPLVNGGFAKTDTVLGDYRGAVRKTLPVSITAPQTLEVLGLPSGIFNAISDRITLFLLLDNTTPALGDGLSVQLDHVAGGFIQVSLFVDGVQVASTTVTSIPDSWVIVDLIPGVSTAHVVKIRIGSTKASPDVVYNLTRTLNAAKTRVGFTMQQLGTLLAQQVDSFSFRYTDSGGGIPPLAAIASAAGLLYRENSTGTLLNVALPADYDLKSDDRLMAVDFEGSLYIADHGQRILSGALTKLTDGAVNVVNPNRITSATIADWTALGIMRLGDMLHVMDGGTAGTAVVAIGTYAINAINAAYLELSSNICSGAGTRTGITFRVCRAPKIFTQPSTFTKLTATAGFVPLNCTMAAIWNNRLMLGGDSEFPQVWFASRQGKFRDFDFFAPVTDEGRALIGTSSFFGASTTTFNGGIGEAIKAMFPLTNDLFVLPGDTTISMLVGDPAVGGRAVTKAQNVGIVGRTPWCVIPGIGVLFLARDGIWIMGFDGEPLPYSVQLPASFEEFSSDLYDVVFAYDVRQHGVHLFFTPKGDDAVAAGGSTEHWWLDLRRMSITEGPLNAFWSVSIPENCDPGVAYYYTATDPMRECVLLGCRDGYIRRFDEFATTDDGATLNSEVFIGPLHLGFDALNEGVIETMVGEMGMISQAGSVNWELRTGVSAQDANSKVVNPASGVWGNIVAGREYDNHPAARGRVAFLRITSANRWALDNVQMLIAEAGPARLP